ncbi:nucleotidyltransferase domain-containing protein [Paenibacillus sp. FSL K6-1566]|uniref:nucleotidyltransferase domain-containing protein n=1 Tax=Paenibacillus sp. FSL K6-1566 TaxID=2954515 RepID=UPI0031015DCB
MFDHHKRALNKLTEALRQDSSILAIITTGSVAQGTARESSDVDVYLVVDDESYAERKKSHNLAYMNHDKEICDYEGGYIDGKIIDLRFLEQAAERGSEPTRYSFVGSRAWFSRIPDLDALLARIPVYPEANRDRNIRDFFAQIVLYGYYFVDEAVKKDNPYLLAHSACQIAFFGSRLILAHNRILFPCHKSLMTAVESAPEKPDGFIQLANDMLRNPTDEKCKAVAGMLLGFGIPGFDPQLSTTVFMENNEWNWLDGEPPLSDR